MNEAAQIISEISDKKTALAFLKNILTPKELEEVGLRIKIFKMLHKGVAQRDIAEKLKVSIGTVSRGSREYQYGPKGIHQFLS